MLQKRRNSVKNKLLLLSVLIIIIISTGCSNRNIEKDIENDIHYQLVIKETNYVDVLQVLNYYNKTKTEEMPKIIMLVGNEDQMDEEEVRVYKGIFDELGEGGEVLESFPYEGFNTFVDIIERGK